MRQVCGAINWFEEMCPTEVITDGMFELDIDDKTGIATLCINNSRKRNAVSFEMMRQLAEAITRLEKWSTVEENSITTTITMNSSFS